MVLVVKKPTTNAGDVRDVSSIPGEIDDNPIQKSLMGYS